MKKLILGAFITCALMFSNVITFAAPDFIVDFSKPEIVTFKTINFNDGNKDKIEIGAQAGFDGNAYKVSIMDQDGGKWFTTGMGLDPNASKPEDFKDLKTISFKYKSTVEFKEEPWIVQIVWKTNDSKKTEVAKIEVPFSVEKGEVQTFTVTVPKETADILNSTTNYYLDWVMIGLKDKANNFRSGTFIVDDITFSSALPIRVKPASAGKFALDFENPGLIGYKTINFNDANLGKIEIGPQVGFSGNAYKVSVMDQDGGKWFTTGIGLDTIASAPEDFKNLKTISFKYKSTVEFKEEPWIVQLVWKANDAKKAAIATLEVPFPVEKGDIQTFTIKVPKATADILDSSVNYYLDWVMVGLKDKANNFRSGTFIMDDLAFSSVEAAIVKPAPAGKFILDFSKPSIVGFKTINFNDGNKDKIIIGPQAGFSGNAYKASIMDQDGGKWFTTGIGLDSKATSPGNFKNLKTITFKYKSSVEFKKEPWIVQIVWKTNDAKKAEVAKIEVPFQVEKGAVKTFTIKVPKGISDKLNSKTNYYLDWVMIGLKDKAKVFRTGSFIVDDIAFNN